MKLAYFCNEVSKRNGWCVINYHTIHQAVLAGHQVTVFTSKNADNEKIEGARYLPVLFDIGKMGQDLPGLLKSFWVIRKHLQKNSPDLVHVLVEPFLIYFSMIKHSKLVLTIVGTYSISIFQKSRLAWLYHKALQKCSSVIAISQYTASRFYKTLGYQKPIKIVPLGVDFETFKVEDSIQVPRELAFCFVGHIKPRKGLIYALKAISILKKSYPQIKFYVAGLFEDEAYSQMCKTYVIESGIQDNVFFLGRVNQVELKRLYAKSIMNLLPSYNSKEGSFEGFGLIHLEANAASTLTLGSKETGNESAIVDGVTGFLVAQENEQELVEKMKQAIDIYQNGQYDFYSKKCLEYAQNNSWEKYFLKLETLYLEAAK